MDLLHRSALWRAIVIATRDRRILTAFVVTTVAGSYALGMGSQVFTNEFAKETKEDLEKKLRRDREAARYASHSKNALAVLFESAQRDDMKRNDGEGDPDAKYKKYDIKLPGVVWHPKVVEREKANAHGAEAGRGEKASSEVR